MIFVSEELAERFYSDLHFGLEAVCPYCKVKAEIRHAGDMSAFDLPDALMKDVVYPSVGLCQRCGRTVLVGFKPARARTKQNREMHTRLCPLELV